MTDRPSLHMTKQQTAEWLGYGDDVAAMDLVHDSYHRQLCKWLGVPSLSMKDAAGEPLTDAERALACIEEDAALAVQRLARHHHNHGEAN